MLRQWVTWVTYGLLIRGARVACPYLTLTPGDAQTALSVAIPLVVELQRAVHFVAVRVFGCVAYRDRRNSPHKSSLPRMVGKVDERHEWT